MYASKVISVDIDITVSFSLEDAYELSCNIDLDIDGAGGHAVIIRWRFSK